MATDPVPTLQDKAPTTADLAPLAAMLMAATWNTGLAYTASTAALDAYDIWEACDERRRQHEPRD